MVMVRVAEVLFVLFIFARRDVNGFRVTGGNVQFSPDQKSLRIQLQLDGPTGAPTGAGEGIDYLTINL
ncbi:hypothetical protein OS493_005243 [Desmophyllum pertusum]|uniref:Uncharacterized protein n=1 Tax=Desmophyllum pertusum TaxID=174260 RepID=A0A9W9Z4Q4_9CNID|nr:hypothetical protein OS493_005243 [Desmophyllum pertusum]